MGSQQQRCRGDFHPSLLRLRAGLSDSQYVRQRDAINALLGICEHH